MTVQESDQITNTIKILREEVYNDERFFDHLIIHIKKELELYNIFVSGYNRYPVQEGIMMTFYFENQSSMNGNILSYFMQSHIWEAFKRTIHYYQYNINRIPHYADMSLHNPSINVTLTDNNAAFILL